MARIERSGKRTAFRFTSYPFLRWGGEKAVKLQAAPPSAEVPAGYQAVDDVARDAARQIERDNPRWIVLFGIYTKEFVCFPRFRATPATVVTAFYPLAAAAR